jgi:hypothetical protein
MWETSRRIETLTAREKHFREALREDLKGGEHHQRNGYIIRIKLYSLQYATNFLICKYKSPFSFFLLLLLHDFS